MHSITRNFLHGEYRLFLLRTAQAISLGEARIPRSQGQIHQKKTEFLCSAQESAPIALKTSEIDSLQIFTSKLCTNFFLKTFFFDEKNHFSSKKIIFSLSGKGLGFFLYNCCIRKIPNPYQNLKFYFFWKFSDFQKTQSRKKKVGLIFGFFFLQDTVWIGSYRKNLLWSPEVSLTVRKNVSRFFVRYFVRGNTPTYPDQLRYNYST